jgi:hypothetical protein
MTEIIPRIMIMAARIPQIHATIVKNFIEKFY